MQFDSLKVDEDTSFHVQEVEEQIVYWNKRRSSGWKVEWSHAEAITIARRDVLGTLWPTAPPSCVLGR